jgi:hypothetical protein
MENNHDLQEEIQMSDGHKNDMWKIGSKYIPIKDLSDIHLQRAKMFAQRKELLYFQRLNLFSELIEKLEAEAERRGITLKDYQAEYFENKKILKT